MKPYPRASISEADGVMLSPDLYNRIVEDIERLNRLTVMPPLFMTGGGSGTTIGFQATPGELVLVGILGIETGGGRYQGTIFYGDSTGSTSSNFQLQSQPNQTETDGPARQTGSGGALVNNALVVNLNEPYVNGTHVLFGNSSQTFYAVGRVMGFTPESTPRTIVYIESWPISPVIAKITGTYQTTSGGVYYGRIVQGQFATGSDFGYDFPLANLSTSYLPSVDNCWITNNWEQTYGTQAHNGLSVGQVCMGVYSRVSAIFSNE